MKVLVLGPSGSGKTYVSQALKRAGINAFDDGEIEGLSAWYSPEGKKVPEPATVEEARAGRYTFLWSRRTLNRFLAGQEEVYLFGGSGNVFDLIDLFDKVYFLKVEPQLQKERLRSPSRPTPLMDEDSEGQVVWGAWFEEAARKHNITFIDASLSPMEIYALIK